MNYSITNKIIHRSRPRVLSYRSHVNKHINKKGLQQFPQNFNQKRSIFSSQTRVITQKKTPNVFYNNNNNMINVSPCTLNETWNFFNYKEKKQYRFHSSKTQFEGKNSIHLLNNNRKMMLIILILLATTTFYFSIQAQEEEEEEEKLNNDNEEKEKELPSDLIKELENLLGDRLELEDSIREAHGKDYSFHSGGTPFAVTYPQSETEVQQIVSLCSKYSVPIVPYGSGTSLEGHISATSGGVCIDMQENMNQVIQVNIEDMDAVVQPGVTWEQLNEYLDRMNVGLFFPLDPGSGASFGGMVGTSCSGTNAVRYGTMKENVLNLRAVLPNGKVVKTGQRARKSSAGYDLTHLFVGAEGTLGVVTQVTVRLYKKPGSDEDHQVSVASCGFPSVTEAAASVIELLQRGINVGRVEIMDDAMIKAVNQNSGFNYPIQPHLFFEVTGDREQIERQMAKLSTITQNHQGMNFQTASNQSERNKLWKARGQALWASSMLRPGADLLITDVCVPISHLAECVKETKLDLEKHHLVSPLVGHVGDGNFHLFVLLDKSNPQEVASVKAMNERLVRRAIKYDGTITGEHGIGSGKRKYLREELGDEAVNLMRIIKQSIDPNNIMNPGKIIPDENENEH